MRKKFAINAKCAVTFGTDFSYILSQSGQISSKSSGTFSLRGAQVLDHPVLSKNTPGPLDPTYF